MIAIGLLVVLAVVIALAVAALQRGHAAVGSRLAPLEEWRAAGLISDDEVAAIRAFEVARTGTAVPSVAAVGTPAAAADEVPPAAPSPGAPVRGRGGPGSVVEALGYLGGVLSVTGVILLVVLYWEDLTLLGQLSLTGATATVLVLGGAAVPEPRSGAMARLRAFLWTLGTAAAAVFAAVAGNEVLGDDAGPPLVAWTAAFVAVLSGCLWWGRRRPVQQFVAEAAAVVAVGTGLVDPAGDVTAGLAVWVAGALLVAFGIRRSTPTPVIEVVVGAAAMVVGAMVTVGDDPGADMSFAVATAAALLAAALHRRLVRDVASVVVLAVIGLLGMLQTAPVLIGTMARDAAVATGACMWVASAAVAILGVARRTRVPLVLEVVGAVGTLVGSAVMAIDSPGVATAVGLITSLGLLGVSLVPGRVALSAVGAAGLLVYVPWTIAWYFPGEGRVPLLISVSGLLIVAVAVLMARWGGRFRHELGHGGAGR